MGYCHPIHEYFQANFNFSPAAISDSSLKTELFLPAISNLGFQGQTEANMLGKCLQLSNGTCLIQSPPQIIMGKKCFSDRVGCFTREKQLVLFETNNKTFLKYLLKMGDTKNQKLLESRKFNILLELSKQISAYLPLPEIIIVEYSILPVQ